MSNETKIRVVVTHAASSLSPRDGLTRRESDVLLLLAQGHCNKLVARELGISLGTVKTHIKGIFGKLGAKSRTQAVILGARHGLIQLDERNLYIAQRPEVRHLD